MLLDNILKQLVLGLKSIYGFKLSKVILYGSYARGNQTPESDVDIAVILNDGVTEEDKEKAFILSSDLGFDNDCILSVIEILKDMYDNWVDVHPFYKNIRDEGVVLWEEV